MATRRLNVTRAHIPAFRRRSGSLDERLPPGQNSLRVAAWAGLQDSALGDHRNALRYAAPTGRVLMRWDGARLPAIWAVPAPALDPADARRELARRYLHVFGPATAKAFAEWAGIAQARGLDVFAELTGSLTPVRTPVGERSILTEAESFPLSAVQGRIRVRWEN